MKWESVQFISSLVGAVGFELTTLCSQSRCATRLRYAPKSDTITDSSESTESARDVVLSFFTLRLHKDLVRGTKLNQFSEIHKGRKV